MKIPTDLKRYTILKTGIIGNFELENCIFYSNDKKRIVEGTLVGLPEDKIYGTVPYCPPPNTMYVIGYCRDVGLWGETIFVKEEE